MSVRTFLSRKHGRNQGTPWASGTRQALALLVGAISALGIVAPGGVGAAGAATVVRIYVQAPAASTVQPEAEIDVPIRIDTSGQHVTVVTANFTYPPDRLSFLSFDDSGSAFPLSAAASASNGLVKISRSVPGTTGVSGDLLVTTAKFRAGPSTGTAALCYSDTDRVLRTSDGADVLGAKTATTYTVGSPSALSLGCLSRNYLAQGAQHSVTLTGRGFAAGMSVAVSAPASPPAGSTSPAPTRPPPSSRSPPGRPTGRTPNTATSPSPPAPAQRSAAAASPSESGQSCPPRPRR